MPNLILDSVVLQEYLNRWRAGDRAAADDLLRMVLARLEKLARRMLQAFPNVRGLADTDDVLQNSLMRLLRTLQRMKPATTRDFFNLAAVHIRRELLDLARSQRGKGTVPLDLAWSDTSQTSEPAIPDAIDADRWVLFHQAVDLLPIEEREVVGLIFYHGWTQRRIAELFNVDERTIRRWWSSACERLKMMVGVDFLDR
ncbi:MAG TPA: sigma-70 family RNA polymerase sigma factor [Gemmata sp.]|nr:sigma-70 family RNA polymerase sigma factor [Gemmata sp.]